MMINYLKAYFEPDTKTLREMAFQSAKEHYKGKHKTREDFQAYQRGYVSSYRRTYAKNKLAKGGV
jgi:cation transport regulator ChaB